jgi:hypothetical protein
MPKTILIPFVLLIIISLPGSACTAYEEVETETGFEEITSLPLEVMLLDDLTEFNAPGDNWSVVGNVISDYLEEYSIEVSDGSGVTVNLDRDHVGEHLFTELEHGDIELKLEFLVPKGSNSGIYFQGRYEVQILDSWRVEDPQFSDVGGIYERWDESRPEGERGYEGAAPKVNASLAPGLWQEYHILFRAPRFNEAGNKTENARFEWVYLNGVLVQEDVEVSGPTRAAAFDDEVPKGPLMFQGDHGPVAFRNIKYKTFSQTDSISLGEMTYKIYDYEGGRTPENFEELELIEEGVTEHFNISELSPKNEHYATTFSGEFEVPISGDYLFETQMNNGGNLYINGELLIENTGEYDNQRLGNIIHLTQGTHQIDVTHFQIIWGTSISIQYEGPGIEKRPLIAPATGGGGGTPPPPVIVDVQETYPEIIGGFFNYGGEKRTHILSVGHPEGIHYSYDLNNSTLLSFWRDPFADVTRMWRGRGHEQLLVPVNAAVESGAEFPLVSLSNPGLNSKEWPESKAGVKRYRLNYDGQPVFETQVNEIQVEDLIAPDETGKEFIRILSFQSDITHADKAARLAQGSSIELLPNGLYRVNGKYYLTLINEGDGTPEIIEYRDKQALIIPILRNSNQSEIHYQLIW